MSFEKPRYEYLNLRRGDVEKWNLNVVCCVCMYESLFVVWLSEFTLHLPPSTLCFAGCLVYTTSVDSLTLWLLPVFSQ